MLKRIFIKRILIASVALFALLLVYMIPKEEKAELKQKLEYVNTDVTTHTIFLLDQNNYLAKTKIIINNSDPLELAKELIECMIIDGACESRIPSGFKSFIPTEAKIIDISLENNKLTLNLNKEAIEIEKQNEEKIIEGLVYTLTSIKEISKIELKIENEKLKQLPKSKINLPEILDRKYGINKVYSITSTDNIQDVTVYYMNKYNDNYYYVPVTKYLNSNEEKIKIVIDELSNNITNNLISYLNQDTKLTNIEKNENILSLEFNDAIFSSLEQEKILEEVIYTITLSAAENYNIKEVSFNVNQKEIVKSVINALE